MDPGSWNNAGIKSSVGHPSSYVIPGIRRNNLSPDLVGNGDFCLFIKYVDLIHIQGELSMGSGSQRGVGRCAGSHLHTLKVKIEINLCTEQLVELDVCGDG